MKKRKNWFWQSISDRDIVTLQSSEDGRKFYSQWQNARREARMSWWFGIFPSIAITSLAFFMFFRTMDTIVSTFLTIVVFGILSLVIKLAILWFNRSIFEGYYDEAVAIAKRHSKNETSVSKVTNQFKF